MKWGRYSVSASTKLDIIILEKSSIYVHYRASANCSNAWWRPMEVHAIFPWLNVAMLLLLYKRKPDTSNRLHYFYKISTYKWYASEKLAFTKRNVSADGGQFFSHKSHNI